MAQLVEQIIRNDQVVGSSPTISSKKRQRRFFFSVFFIRLNLIIADFFNTARNNNFCKIWAAEKCKIAYCYNRVGYCN